MNNEVFVQYLNNDDVHDARVRQVIEEPDQVRVLVDTADGRLVIFQFSGVRDVRQNRPENMLLYSLTELREVPPFRRFRFTNWDEEDNASLEVIALAMSSTESSQDSAVLPSSS